MFIINKLCVNNIFSISLSIGVLYKFIRLYLNQIKQLEYKNGQIIHSQVIFYSLIIVKCIALLINFFFGKKYMNIYLLFIFYIY